MLVVFETDTDRLELAIARMPGAGLSPDMNGGEVTRVGHRTPDTHHITFTLHIITTHMSCSPLTQEFDRITLQNKSCSITFIFIAYLCSKVLIVRVPLLRT